MLLRIASHRSGWWSVMGINRNCILWAFFLLNINTSDEDLAVANSWLLFAKHCRHRRHLSAQMHSFNDQSGFQIDRLVNSSLSHSWWMNRLWESFFGFKSFPDQFNWWLHPSLNLLPPLAPPPTQLLVQAPVQYPTLDLNENQRSTIVGKATVEQPVSQITRSLASRADLVCRVRYTNVLPDLPFDPKYLRYPFSQDRYIVLLSCLQPDHLLLLD